jgi:hypothetical protein
MGVEFGGWSGCDGEGMIGLTLQQLRIYQSILDR